MSGTPVAKRAEVALRRTEAIKMRNGGATWEEVAETLGYASRGAAQTDVTRALKAYVDMQGLAAEELRARELSDLDAIRDRVLDVMNRRHVIVQNGKIVRDWVDGEPGEPLEDSGPVLAAADRLLKISERRARLLGLDAPVKVEGGVQVTYNIVGINMETLR